MIAGDKIVVELFVGLDTNPHSPEGFHVYSSNCESHRGIVLDGTCGNVYIVVHADQGPLGAVEVKNIQGNAKTC